jgi:hypothetical protein
MGLAFICNKTTCPSSLQCIVLQLVHQGSSACFKKVHSKTCILIFRAPTNHSPYQDLILDRQFKTTERRRRSLTSPTGARVENCHEYICTARKFFENSGSICPRSDARTRPHHSSAAEARDPHTSPGRGGHGQAEIQGRRPAERARARLHGAQMLLHLYRRWSGTIQAGLHCPAPHRPQPVCV